MPEENAIVDDNRHAVLLGMERGTVQPINFELIEQNGMRFLPVALYSYNPGSLAWEAGVNLVYDGDLELNMGDVEKGVTNTYWRCTKWEWDGVRSLPLYMGKHTDTNPADSDVNHFITKYTWHGTLSVPLKMQIAVGA